MRILHWLEISNFKGYRSSGRIPLELPSAFIGPNNCSKPPPHSLPHHEGLKHRHCEGCLPLGTAPGSAALIGRRIPVHPNLVLCQGRIHSVACLPIVLLVVDAERRSAGATALTGRRPY